MKIINIETDDVVNGSGLGVVVWCSFCSIGCKGCHNAWTQDGTCGDDLNEEHFKQILEYTKESYITRLTLSGGHPFEDRNIAGSIEIINAVREQRPDIKVWAYSGLTFEQLVQDEQKLSLLKECDVLVDGPFILAQRDITLAFRGSSNQRIIDVKKSLEKGEVILRK